MQPLFSMTYKPLSQRVVHMRLGYFSDIGFKTEIVDGDESKAPFTRQRFWVENLKFQRVLAVCLHKNSICVA